MHFSKISKYVVIVILFGVMAPGFAQDQERKAAEPPIKPPKNKIEAFVSRSGVLLVKKMYAIKTFTWGSTREETVAFAVGAMHSYEADQKNQGVFGVRFEGRPLKGTPTSAILDLASAQSLIKALGDMIAQGKENVLNAPEFLEVKFALGDSFECGFNQQGTVQMPFCVLGTDVSRTFRSTRMADLEDLKSAIAEDIEKLKELGAN